MVLVVQRMGWSSPSGRATRTKPSREVWNVPCRVNEPLSAAFRDDCHFQLKVVRTLNDVGGNHREKPRTLVEIFAVGDLRCWRSLLLEVLSSGCLQVFIGNCCFWKTVIARRQLLGEARRRPPSPQPFGIGEVYAITREVAKQDWIDRSEILRPKPLKFAVGELRTQAQPRNLASLKSLNMLR